eukprot:447866_1
MVKLCGNQFMCIIINISALSLLFIMVINNETSNILMKETSNILINKTNNTLVNETSNILIKTRDATSLTLTTEEQTWCNNILKSYDQHTTNDYGMHIQEKTFVSQFYQDWFLYSSIFRQMQKQNKRGVYIDLAANDYKFISNTYFLDKCLSWTGICIEPQFPYHKNILLHRTCTLIENCIWNETKQIVWECC